MTSHPSQLSGTWAKLRRAGEHLNSFKSLAKVFAEGQPLVMRGELHGDRMQVFVKFREGLPPTLSVIVGDFLNNARSTLDYLALELAVRSQTADRGCTSVYFPIIVKKLKRKQAAKS